MGVSLIHFVWGFVPLLELKSSTFHPVDLAQPYGGINGVESGPFELQELTKSPYKMYERNPHTKCMREKSPYKMYERSEAHVFRMGAML
jgi:hypothetical protein